MFPTKSFIVPAAAVLLATPALAGITVFDNRSMYEMWADVRSGVSLAREDFSTALPGLTSDSFVGKVGLESEWHASAVGGLQANAGMLRTVQAGKAVSFDFSTNRVFGVGADFFYNNALGAPVSGYVVLGLSDGTQYVRSVSGVDSFAGFWSDGAAITRLTITPVGSSGLSNYLGTDNMSIGYAPLPAPGAVAAVLIAGLRSRRRRA